VTQRRHVRIGSIHILSWQKLASPSKGRRDRTGDLDCSLVGGDRGGEARPNAKTKELAVPSRRDERAKWEEVVIAELSAGLTGWAVHPGLGSDESRAIEPACWPVRRADYEFVTSPEAKSVIEEEGIVLLSYRELQTLWATLPSR
jgi:hypothetical protein